MIRETFETFEKLLDKHGDKIIYQNKVLGKGTYVIVSSDKKSYEVFDVDEKQDFFNIDVETRMKLIKMNYFSCLVDMNKPVDFKKTIHSNNYMSFFLKKNHVISEEDNSKRDIKKQSKEHQLVLNCVDRYFDTIESIVPSENSTKKADLELLGMYESLGEPLKPIDKKVLEENKKWIKDNILLLKEDNNYRDDDNYLKIFFEDTEERYLNEFNRYFIPKVFNSNAYNTFIDEILHGLPNDNMQLNQNKPSLKCLTRKNVCPVLLPLKDALLQYKYFNYLMTFIESGERVVYVDEEGFYSYNDIKSRMNTFNGYVIKLSKGTSLDVSGFDIVAGYNPKKLKRKFNFQNVLDVNCDESSKQYYEVKTSLFEIHDLVDKIIFDGKLKTNYFNDDIKLKNKIVEKALKSTKEKMFNWFYLGKEKEGHMLLRKYIPEIIKQSIIEGYKNKSRHQFNLFYSLILHYEYEGSRSMEQIKDIREAIIAKLYLNCENGEAQYLDSDEQYYFAVGQVIKYLLSLKNTNKISQADINIMLNCKNDTQLKREIEKLYKKYNHSKYANSKKFRALYAMVLAYNPNSRKVNTTNLLAGYLGLTILKNNEKKDA